MKGAELSSYPVIMVPARSVGKDQYAKTAERNC